MIQITITFDETVKMPQIKDYAALALTLPGVSKVNIGDDAAWKQAIMNLFGPYAGPFK